MKPMQEKRADKKPAADRSGFDLVATGKSGNWSVFLDETPAGRPQKWFVQINSPALYLSCEIASLDVVKKLVRYLKEPPVLNGVAEKPTDRTLSLRLGTIKKTRVGITRDPEDPGRCFLTVGDSAQVVRVAVAGDDLRKLRDAIQQLEQELVNEGLL
jgi:hypothetical protein